MRLTSLVLAASFAVLTPCLVPASAQEVGVASCDKFLQTYQSCIIDKAAADQKTKLVAEFDKTKANWKAVGANDAGKAELDATCKKTTETVKTQLAALNCPW